MFMCTIMLLFGLVALIMDQQSNEVDGRVLTVLVIGLLISFTMRVLAFPTPIFIGICGGLSLVLVAQLRRDNGISSPKEDS